MKSPAARLMLGRTVHRREAPFTRRFAYRIAMVDIDIDRLGEADGLSRLFSVNGRAALNFRPRDHGERRKDADLRTWAEQRFAEAGVDVAGCAIRLLAFPRVLGVGFSPIAVWRALDAEGVTRGVIYEVHNTFGEAHAYVTALPQTTRAMASKEFFVSPFFGVDGDYRFTLRESPDPGRIELIVENFNVDGRTHVASLLARARPVTSAAIAGTLFAMPLSGLGVMFAIHWQALKLWLNGAPYRDKPPQRATRTTIAAAPPATNRRRMSA